MGDYTNLSIKLDISPRPGRQPADPDRAPDAAPEPADRPAHGPADVRDHQDPRRRDEVPAERRHHQQGLPEGARRPAGAAPPDREVQEEEALTTTRSARRSNALPSLPTKGPLPSLSLPDRAAPVDPRRRWRARRQPDGVRTARADHAAAVADVRPGAGRPARPGAGDEPMITASYQGPARDLRADHDARRELRRREVRPAEPPRLLHVVHRGRALPGLRRDVRRRAGRPTAASGWARSTSWCSPTTASTPTSRSSTAGTTRSRRTPSPSSATARPSGEQYVDLQPQTDNGPYLHDGSQIAMADTRTPLPDPEAARRHLERPSSR